MKKFWQVRRCTVWAEMGIILLLEVGFEILKVFWKNFV